MTDMDLEKGKAYELPEGADPSWFAEALREERRIRVGEVRINLHLRGETTVSGGLDSTDEHGDWGNVYIDNPANEDELQPFPCETIAAFTLWPDPPLDRSDELRGE